MFNVTIAAHPTNRTLISKSNKSCSTFALGRIARAARKKLEFMVSEDRSFNFIEASSRDETKPENKKLSRRSFVRAGLVLPVILLAAPKTASAEDAALDEYYASLAAAQTLLPELRQEVANLNWNVSRSFLRIPPFSNLRKSMFKVSQNLGEDAATKAYKDTIRAVEDLDYICLQATREEGEESATKNLEKAQKSVDGIVSNLDRFVSYVPSEVWSRYQ